MDTDTIYLIIAIIGCLIGVYGWYNGQMKKASSAKEEFVKVNVKLDNLCDGVSVIKDDLKEINRNVDALSSKQLEHEFRIQALEKKMIINHEKSDN